MGAAAPAARGRVAVVVGAGVRRAPLDVVGAVAVEGAVVVLTGAPAVATVGAGAVVGGVVGAGEPATAEGRTPGLA